jgi:translation initiation factor 1
MADPPRRGIVYHSSPQTSGERCPRCGWPIDSCACAKKDETAGPLAGQRVRVSRSSAGRGGKTVTLVAGLEGGDAVLAPLAKKLKARCGAGGTVKDGVVEIQGDHVETVIALLAAEGYRSKRSGG